MILEHMTNSRTQFLSEKKKKKKKLVCVAHIKIIKILIIAQCLMKCGMHKYFIVVVKVRHIIYCDERAVV